MKFTFSTYRTILSKQIKIRKVEKKSETQLGMVLLFVQLNTINCSNSSKIQLIKQLSVCCQPTMYEIHNVTLYKTIVCLLSTNNV